MSNPQVIPPEFGRAADVQRIFGLKRGTLYNLLKDRKIRGCVLQVRGARSGVRLFHLGSIRDYIERTLIEQESEPRQLVDGAPENAQLMVGVSSVNALGGMSGQLHSQFGCNVSVCQG